MGGCDDERRPHRHAALQSPEQALAKRVIVDHRTDIYSLGVTLYELLTLQPAYTGRDRQELLRQIAFEEARPPRRLNSSIPAELETITLKAMAKNPDERYATAQELADDLRCYLLDRPIRAKRPSLAARARKWSRRHRALVNSAAVLIVMGVVGLSISTVLLSRKQAEVIKERNLAVENYQQAEKERANADKLRERVQANFRDARDALDELTGIVTKSRDTLGNTPEVDAVRQQILEASLHFYERHLEEEGTGQTAQLESGKTHRKAGELQWDLGKQQEGEKSLRKSIDILTRLVAESPATAEYRSELSDSYYALGWRLHSAGKAAEAMEPLERALAINEELKLGSPEWPDYQFMVAQCYNCLGVAESDPKRKEASLRKAIEMCERLVAKVPEKRFYREVLLVYYQNLSDCLRSDKRFKDAEEALGRSINLGNALISEDPKNAHYAGRQAWTKLRLAFVREEVGEWYSEIAAYSDAFAFWEQQTLLCGRRDHGHVGDLRSYYGNIRSRAMRGGHPEVALEFTRREAAFWRRLADERPDDTELLTFLRDAETELAKLLTQPGQSGEGIEMPIPEFEPEDLMGTTSGPPAAGTEK
ncbi:MAG: protein kinase [Planctomycetes bacterium]|nr:protein kinase [Planctomycetota bacterium]